MILCFVITIIVLDRIAIIWMLKIKLHKFSHHRQVRMIKDPTWIIIMILIILMMIISIVIIMIRILLLLMMIIMMGILLLLMMIIWMLVT